MTPPLAGIRILDFTRYQQGPFATVMLGDMGAEIIKIEDTGIGDYGRRMWREPGGYSAFWEALDRGRSPSASTSAQSAAGSSRSPWVKHATW